MTRDTPTLRTDELLIAKKFYCLLYELHESIKRIAKYGFDKDTTKDVVAFGYWRMLNDAQANAARQLAAYKGILTAAQAKGGEGETKAAPQTNNSSARETMSNHDGSAGAAPAPGAAVGVEEPDGMFTLRCSATLVQRPNWAAEVLGIPLLENETRRRDRKGRSDE